MDPNLFGGYPGARMIGEEEIAAVSDVVRARSPYRFYGMEPKRRAEALEAALACFTGRRRTLAVSSGTAALHVALHAVGVRAGDEVVIPAYGWSANIMAVLAVGGQPVIAPIDETLGLDPERLDECFSDKTRAVIGVHMRGYPCDLTGVIAAAESRGIRVIEDGAQCIGGTISGAPVGAKGDISIFSFQYNKLITGGEGGAVMAEDENLITRARRFHDLGMLREVGAPDPEGDNCIDGFGLNYRLGEMPAAMTLVQLSKVGEILSNLAAVRERALDALAEVIAEFGLSERPAAPETAPNNAFLCLQAADGETAAAAVERLRELRLPVHHSGRVDPHHFQTWTAFLERDRASYRCVAGAESVTALNRNLFLELNPAG